MHMETMWQELGELTALPEPLVGEKGHWLPLPKNPSPLLATDLDVMPLGPQV